jgi:hypothetical protein
MNLDITEITFKNLGQCDHNLFSARIGNNFAEDVHLIVRKNSGIGVIRCGFLNECLSLNKVAFAADRYVNHVMELELNS